MWVCIVGRKGLTKGKGYHCTNDMDGMMRLIDDTGKSVLRFKSRFKFVSFKKYNSLCG